MQLLLESVPRGAVQLLLDRGANANQLNKGGLVALTLASQVGMVDITAFEGERCTLAYEMSCLKLGFLQFRDRYLNLFCCDMLQITEYDRRADKGVGTRDNERKTERTALWQYKIHQNWERAML